MVLQAVTVTNGRIENQIRPPSKVRVTFFEAEKPTYVSSPESADCSLELDIPIMSSTPSPNHDRNPGYMRQLSTDSGKDNPFRPDGDLSREADQIVEMIREGRPITLTPTPELPEHQLDGMIPLSDYEDHGSTIIVSDGHISPARKSALADLQQEPPPSHKTGANGNAPPHTTELSPNAEQIEVQRGLAAPPQDASQVEHVVIKKKPKCKCCEIM